MRQTRRENLTAILVAWLCLAYFAALFVGCVVAIWYLVTHIPH